MLVELVPIQVGKYDQYTCMFSVSTLLTDALWSLASSHFSYFRFWDHHLLASQAIGITLFDILDYHLNPTVHSTHSTNTASTARRLIFIYYYYGLYLFPPINDRYILYYFLSQIRSKVSRTSTSYVPNGSFQDQGQAHCTVQAYYTRPRPSHEFCVCFDFDIPLISISTLCSSLIHPLRRYIYFISSFSISHNVSIYIFLLYLDTSLHINDIRLQYLRPRANNISPISWYYPLLKFVVLKYFYYTVTKAFGLAPLYI